MQWQLEVLADMQAAQATTMCPHLGLREQPPHVKCGSRGHNWHGNYRRLQQVTAIWPHLVLPWPTEQNPWHIAPVVLICTYIHSPRVQQQPGILWEVRHRIYRVRWLSHLLKVLLSTWRRHSSKAWYNQDMSANNVDLLNLLRKYTSFGWFV